jgi:DNA-binding transcriptional LysR family regulator
LNFTKTAKELYITQQAVSQHISRLEEDMGFPLFIRSRHFVALTQAGKNCYAFFSETSRRYKALVAEARTQYAAFSRTISAGYQNWIDLGPAVGAALQRLHKEAPDLDLSAERSSPGALINRLMNRELQISSCTALGAAVEGLEVIKLMDTPIVLMVSPDNPMVTEDATFETFIHEPFIIDRLSRKPAQTNRRRSRRSTPMVLAPSRVIVVPDRDSAYTAAEWAGTVITTGINRIVRRQLMKVYQTGVMESCSACGIPTRKTP